jgi:hypothetical protein
MEIVGDSSPDWQVLEGGDSQMQTHGLKTQCLSCFLFNF